MLEVCTNNDALRQIPQNDTFQCPSMLNGGRLNGVWMV